MIPLEHQAPAPIPRRRGRPVLGAISGFFLGVFVWLDLILFGVMPLESGLGYAFPVVGIALGVGVAMWAPFGSASPAAPPVVPPVAQPDQGEELAPPSDLASSPEENAQRTAPPDDDQPSTSTTSDGA